MQDAGIRADIRKLSEVSKVFSDDMHWETPCSLGLAAYLDGKYEEAKDYLERSISIIEQDPNIEERKNWERMRRDLEGKIALCNEHLLAQRSYNLNIHATLPNPN